MREGAGCPGAGRRGAGRARCRSPVWSRWSPATGIGRIFQLARRPHLVVGGQSMNPSTAEILEAVEALASDDVVVLPNNKNIRPVAEQVDGLTDKAVRVVPTRSIVEGFAALLAYDPGASARRERGGDDRVRRRVVSGEVTRAVRDADSDAGPVDAGDWIGLSRDGVVAVGSDRRDAACGLLDGLLGDDHELVTMIEGEGATAATPGGSPSGSATSTPQVAVEVHHGGQPLYPYLFGIE